MLWLSGPLLAARIVVAVASIAASATGLAANASADPSSDGNSQSTYELCKDADWARLHPLLCSRGGFSLTPPSVGHGGGRGLLGSLLHLGGLL